MEVMERSKLFLMVLLCAAATVLTYYFHGVFKISTVFTHLFYIPIILSAIWWRRRGFFITVLLCTVLLSGHMLFGPAYLLSPYSNYMRVVIFIAVSLIVIYLSEQLDKSRSALQARKDFLEAEVQARTRELAAANAHLQQSEAQIRRIVENAPVGIAIVQNGRYAYANTKLIEMFGHTHPSEIVDKTVESIFDAQHADLIAARSADRLAGKAVPATYDLKGVKSSGVRFDVTLWLTVVEYQNMPAILGFMIDASLERKLRDQIMHSQKMESIGVLAGGIAHKFNNALTSITGSVGLIEAGFPEDPSLRKNIDRIVNSVDQMVNLNRQLLAYARRGHLRPARIQLNPVVKETLQLLRHQHITSYDIQTDLEEDLPDIFVDATQMQIIITAIFKNAVEAIQEKGSITIKTFQKSVDGQTAGKHPGMAPGDYVCFHMRDTGAGMDAESLNRIFEPFYTTRFQGRGLGMAAVYGIVKDHNGWIGVDSEPGKGTEVTGYFPTLE